MNPPRSTHKTKSRFLLRGSLSCAAAILGLGTTFTPAAASEVWKATVLPGHQEYFGGACDAAMYSFVDIYGGSGSYFWGCDRYPIMAAVGFGPQYLTQGLWTGSSALVGCTEGETMVDFVCKKEDDAPVSPNLCVGNPIDAISGNKLEHIVDYSSGGPDPLTLERYYSSQKFESPSMFSSSLIGKGWRTNFDAAIFNMSRTVQIRMPNGALYVFKKNFSTELPSAWIMASTGTIEEIPSVGESLRVVDGKYELTTPEGVIYVFANDALIQIRKPGGYQQNLARGNAGGVIEVTDNKGRSLTLVPQNGLITAAKVGSTTVASFEYAPLLSPSDYGYIYPDPTKVPTSLLYVSAVLKKVAYPGAPGEYLSYSYDDPLFRHGLTSVTDGRGIRYATWSYDALGRAVSSEHAGGVDTTKVAYEAANRRAIITNAANKQAYLNYTIAKSRRILPTSIVGQPSLNCPISNTTYTWDDNDHKTSEIDAEGRQTSYERNSLGLPTKITRGSGTADAAATTIDWNLTWRQPARIVEPGLTTTLVWDADGKLTSVSSLDTTTTTAPYATTGQTRTISYEYDANARLLKASGPLADVAISYAYNANGDLASVTNEMGQITRIDAVNFRGQPTQLTDPNGIVTSLSYDGRGRLSAYALNAAGAPATTNIAYTLAGDIASITPPDGAALTFAYDGARRLIGIANAVGEKISYTRDSLGGATAIAVSSASGSVAYTKTRMFDELGRLLKSVGAQSETYAFSYDRTDNQIAVKDPRGNNFSYGFDALNRLTKETDESGAATNLTRSPTDAITHYQDARNLATSYARNGFGEIIQEVSPDRGATTYVRDARGLITQKTDARGVIINYTYDNAGRLTGKNYPGNFDYWESYSWDQSAPDNKGVGRLVGLYNQDGQDWRVYDAFGRVSANYRTNKLAPSLVVKYSYNQAGDVTQIVYPSGRAVNYLRDAAGRIKEISTAANLSLNTQAVIYDITWNPFGPLSKFTFPNGMIAGFSYDSDYRVTRVQVGSAAAPGVTLDRSLSWTGDMVDSIADNQNSGSSPPFAYSAQSQLMTYTPTRRLASAKGYYGALAWTYDSNGNRLSETANEATSVYAYPANSNRLASVTTAGNAKSFAYDAAGNMILDSRAGGLGMSFEYDVEGRLSKAYKTNAPGDAGVYKYDNLSRISSRSVTQTIGGAVNAATLYVHDIDNHIIAETDATGQTLREYIWLGDLPVAAVDKVNTASPVVYNVHTDHLGRPARMTKMDWSWVWDVIYKPFGEVSYIWSNPAVLDMRFPGQWFQLESGLAYNWHRHYDATLGRYIQPDPLGLPALLSDGPSVYGYVGGNPFGYVDPSGQWGVYAFIGGASMDAGTQLLHYGLASGDLLLALRCINLTSVAVSGVVGGVAPTLFSNFLFNKRMPAGVERAMGLANVAYNSRVVQAPMFAKGWELGFIGKNIIPEWRPFERSCDECDKLKQKTPILDFIHSIY